MLPPSTQIGGKGTVRRKRKRVGNNFLEKKTKNHREYELKIKQINNMIKDISDDDEYTKFKLYLDTEFEDIGIAIEKHDLLKKAKKDFSEIFTDTEMRGVIQDRIEDNPKPEWIFSYFSKLSNKE